MPSQHAKLTLRFIVPTLFIALLTLTSSKSFADLNEMDSQFMRMMQQKAEQNGQEQDFSNPKRPNIEKDRAVLGSRNASIPIVVYSDFQCPYCQKGAQTVEEVRKKYGKKVLYVFKHFPLPMHPLAMPAAKRFEAIAMQDAKKAYKFHDELFQHQDEMAKGEVFLDETAKKVGANVKKMLKDMESEKVANRIKAASVNSSNSDSKKTDA